MSEDLGCIHGMDDPAWCSMCSGKKDDDRETIEYGFAAQFDSHCDECNLPVSVGQRIAKMSTGRYIHEACT